MLSSNVREYCMRFGKVEFNDTIRANLCEVCIFIFHMQRSCTTYRPVPKVYILPSKNNGARIIVLL